MINVGSSVDLRCDDGDRVFATMLMCFYINVILKLLLSHSPLIASTYFALYNGVVVSNQCFKETIECSDGHECGLVTHVRLEQMKANLTYMYPSYTSYVWILY